MRFPLLRLFLFPLIIALSGCEKSSDSSLKAGSGSLRENIHFRTTLTTSDQFQKFSQESEGLIQGGRSLKFFITLKTTPAQVYFINGNRSVSCRIEPECTKYHFDFGRELGKVPEGLSEFNKYTYDVEDKRYIAGTLASYQQGGEEILAIQLNPSDVAKEDTLLKVSTLVKNAIRIPDQTLSFVQTNNIQKISSTRAAFDSIGVRILSLDDILGENPYRAMNTGEALGYLRIFPKDQDELVSTDIVVFDELPLDLTVVAGVVTKAFQDTNSHINLKSKQRQTPNMMLRDLTSILQWENKPIKLTVGKNGYTIEASTPEAIEFAYQKRYGNINWTEKDAKIKFKATRELKSYDEMCVRAPARCFELADFYGTKAANLGFLKEIWKDKSIPDADPLTYDPVPVGFGVPLQFYNDFIELEANKAVKEKIESLIAQEKSGLLSAKERTRLAAEVRDAILNASLPEENLNAILQKISSVAPDVKKWKIRSSANAEDIENFDGAGLHDSYSSNLKNANVAGGKCELVPDDDETAEAGAVVTKMEVKPKSVACAIKGVYASLWNRRAIDERTFAHLNHSKVSMGLSILPTYANESPVKANSVVITRVVNSEDVWGYTLSIQRDNNTVTNPLPGSWSEVTIARPRGLDGGTATLSTIRFAKPTAAEETLKDMVLSEALTFQMAQIARKTEIAYCKNRPGYYPAQSCYYAPGDRDKPKALDMEMKYLENGEFVLKQVREFTGK